MSDKDIFIDHIINSLKNFALRDIKKIGKEDTVLSSFILCSCFIDQLSGFRYNTDSVKKRYIQFVKDYLQGYNALALYEDLRNKLVHNYSLGNSYTLTWLEPKKHLIALGNSTLINLENFIEELENAFNRYESELISDLHIRNNALQWFGKYKIIGSDKHDFYTYEQAENIVKENRKATIGFSKTNTWPFFIKFPLIAPSGSDFNTMWNIVKNCTDNNCNNKQALINLSLFENKTFDVFISGTDKEVVAGSQMSFIKLSDYVERIENAS